MPYEAEIRLTFDEPCLGNERFPDPEPNRMARNVENNVIFRQVWWRTLLTNAAEAYSKHQGRVKVILWTPEVDGTVKLYKRYYYTGTINQRVRRFKHHEAFLRGDTIGVKALVPDDIPIEDLKEILEIAGKYFGISPFGWNRGYGKFTVKEVKRVYGKRRKAGGVDHQGQPDVHPSGDPGNSADC